MRTITALMFLTLSWRINPTAGQCSEEDWSSFGTRGKETVTQCSNDSLLAGLNCLSDSFDFDFTELNVISKAKCCKVAVNSDCIEQELEWPQSGNSWTECPAGRVFQGLTTNGDGWINAISKGTCCKVQGHPDADGECKDVDIAIKVGSVNECPGGYFVKGFYWNGAFPIFSAISKFRCCQLESASPAPPVDGGWSPWSDWSDCDKECGGGSQNRTRTCSQPPPSKDGKPCIGDSQETRSCNKRRCQWNKWSKWGACNKSCGGGGVKIRTRTCQGTPPCGGKVQQTKACGNRKCHE